MSYAKEYAQFFTSEAGASLLKEIDRLITDKHKEAEKNPEMSRDYTQRAKGNREVLDHIQSVMTPIKKGRL